MFELRRPRPPLIVDPDLSFLNSMKQDPKAQQIPPVIAEQGKKAQLLLANPTQNFAAVFVNPFVSDPHGFSVIRFAHLHRPAIPIFILYDKESPISDEDMKKLAVQKAFPKSMGYAEIARLIAPHTLYFDPSAAIEEAKANSDLIGKEITADDSTFLSIRADNFLSGSKSFFDIYVRLSQNHYVKILQAGEDFSPQRIAQYLNKGVTHFFLRKEAQERYLGYCDQITAAIIKNDKISAEVKVSQTLNHGQETMNFLKGNGISESNLEYANNFISNVQNLTTQLNPEKHDFLKTFMADLAAYEHGVGTAMIASLLINPLKIGAAQPVKIIGIGSLLHDIGLYKMDPALKDEVESKMTPEQIQIYQTHPTVGAEMLGRIKGIDPVVVQAVSQHHERRNKTGFPMRLGTGYINRVAEIIGISDEFTRLIKKQKDDPKIDIQKLMELTIYEGFSNYIVDAFKFVFFSHSKDTVKKKPTLKTL